MVWYHRVRDFMMESWVVHMILFGAVGFIYLGRRVADSTKERWMLCEQVEPNQDGGHGAVPSPRGHSRADDAQPRHLGVAGEDIAENELEGKVEKEAAPEAEPGPSIVHRLELATPIVVASVSDCGHNKGAAGPRRAVREEESRA